MCSNVIIYIFAMTGKQHSFQKMLITPRFNISIYRYVIIHSICVVIFSCLVTPCSAIQWPLHTYKDTEFTHLLADRPEIVTRLRKKAL